MRKDTKNNFLVIYYYSIETPQLDKSHLKLTASWPSFYPHYFPLCSCLFYSHQNLTNYNSHLLPVYLVQIMLKSLLKKCIVKTTYHFSFPTHFSVIILKLFTYSYMYMFWSYLPSVIFSFISLPLNLFHFQTSQCISPIFCLLFNDPPGLNKVASMSVAVGLFTRAWIICKWLHPGKTKQQQKITLPPLATINCL